MVFSMISGYIALVKDYFYSKKLFIFSLFCAFCIYIFHFCLDTLFDSDQFSFIYFEFIQPFFIYISVVFILFYYSRSGVFKKKYEELTYKEILIIALLFLLKYIWNFAEVVCLETDIVQTNENSNLFFLFLLGITWLVIYFIGAFFLPKQFLIDSNKTSFIHYSKKNFFPLIIYFLFSVILVFFIIFFFTLIISKIALMNFFSCQKIHFVIEEVVAIYFSVLLSHLIAIYFLGMYGKPIKK